MFLSKPYMFAFIIHINLFTKWSTKVHKWLVFSCEPKLKFILLTPFIIQA